MDGGLLDSLSRDGTRRCRHQGSRTGVSLGWFGALLLGASSGSFSSVKSLERVRGTSTPVTGHHLSLYPCVPHPPPPGPVQASQSLTALPTGFHSNDSLLQGGLGRRVGSLEKHRLPLLLSFFRVIYVLSRILICLSVLKCSVTRYLYYASIIGPR